ncbi:uncharacterized protein LOC144790916 [Lissotriton helveticus]
MALHAVKEALIDNKVMAYYRCNRHTEVVMDASPLGLGAVLMQEMEAKEWVQTAYASRALTGTEMRHIQIPPPNGSTCWMLLVPGAVTSSHGLQEVRCIMLGFVEDGTLVIGLAVHHGKYRQVSAYEKGEIWVDIARAVRSEGGPRRRLRNIKKRWQDIRCWSRRIARVQLKLEAPRRHGGSRQLTPNMLRVLEVVFPDLHRQLQEGQQHEGASSSESGGDRGADQAEGHTDSATCWEVSEGGSGTEWEESLQAARHVTDTSYHADESETDSQEGGEYAAMVTHTSLAALPSSSPISNLPLLGVPRVRASPRVSFVPGTAAPAPVSPAALSAETVDLLRQIAVGQASMLSVLHGHTQLITQVVSFMEGMSSAMSDLRRSVAAIESTLTAAMYTQQHLSPPHPSEPSTSASHIPTQHTRTRHRSDTPSAHTQHKKLKAPRTQSQGQVGTPTGRGETPHTHIHTPSRTDSQPCTSTPNVSPGSGGSFSALAEVCSQVFESTFGDAPTSVDESTTPAPTPPVLPSPVHAVPEDSTDGAPIVSTAD